jgi:HSP20 family protein
MMRMKWWFGATPNSRRSRVMEAAKVTERIKVGPDICSYIDDEGEMLIVEISIPGVKKENVDLKLTEDSLYLNAPRDDVEYVGALAFCCPVVPDRGEAHYEDGLLRVTVPFRDEMAHAVHVKIE